MNSLQDPFAPVAGADVNQDFTTKLASQDELFLPVSIYLESDEGRGEIVQNVVGVMRSYGFNLVQWEEAPGTRYIHLRGKHADGDVEESRKSKRELKEDLLKKELPSHPRRRKAVEKLKKSLWSRSKKKIVTIIVAGAVYLGTLSGDIVKDAIKDKAEEWLKNNGPQIAQKADDLVVEELPPAIANQFHRAVKGYIDSSPKKTSPPIPKQ